VGHVRQDFFHFVTGHAGPESIDGRPGGRVAQVDEAKNGERQEEREGQYRDNGHAAKRPAG
jgi:hypothetical protein